MPQLLQGVAYTLVAAGIGVALSLTLGSILGVLQAFRIPLLRQLVRGYVEVIRNTPELIQLYWIYLALPHLGVNLTINQAVLGYLVINGTAYMTEIVRGAILSIPRGQFEAGHSLGIKGLRLYRRIILPQAVRKVVPPLMNQTIQILKNTTIVYAIAAPDLVYFVNRISSQTMDPVPFQLFIAALFFTVITFISYIARRFEAGRRIA